MEFLYVSNAGILLKSRNVCIGFDLFCKDNSGIYRDTPEPMKHMLFQAIQSGQIDTLVFTHEHADHFCAEDVREVPGDPMIITNQETARLIEEGRDRNSLRVIAPAACYEPVWVTIKDVRLGFMQTPHEGEQYQHVCNLTVLIEAEGKCMVVTGDARPDEAFMEAIAAWSGQINYLFAPFPYVGLKKNRKLLKAFLDIAQVFAYHLPRANVNVNWVNSAKEICSHAEDGLPVPVFAENIGNWYRIG